MAIANRCTKTIFDRVILCAGAMTDYFMIKSRALQGTTANNTQLSGQFATIINMLGYLEAKKPTQRFDGVNIGAEVTHLGYLPFDQTVYELDKNTCFVEIERNKNRYFKLLSIMNYGEQDEYILFYLKETGFTDIEAAKI